VHALATHDGHHEVVRVLDVGVEELLAVADFVGASIAVVTPVDARLGALEDLIEGVIDALDVLGQSTALFFRVAEFCGHERDLDRSHGVSPPVVLACAHWLYPATVRQGRIRAVDSKPSQPTRDSWTLRVRLRTSFTFAASVRQGEPWVLEGLVELVETLVRVVLALRGGVEEGPDQEVPVFLVPAGALGLHVAGDDEELLVLTVQDGDGTTFTQPLDRHFVVGEVWAGEVGLLGGVLLERDFGVEVDAEVLHQNADLHNGSLVPSLPRRALAVFT